MNSLPLAFCIAFSHWAFGQDIVISFLITGRRKICWVPNFLHQKQLLKDRNYLIMLISSLLLKQSPNKLLFFLEQPQKTLETMPHMHCRVSHEWCETSFGSTSKAPWYMESVGYIKLNPKKFRNTGMHYAHILGWE